MLAEHLDAVVDDERLLRVELLDDRRRTNPAVQQLVLPHGDTRVVHRAGLAEAVPQHLVNRLAIAEDAQGDVELAVEEGDLVNLRLRRNRGHLCNEGGDLRGEVVRARRHRAHGRQHVHGESGVGGGLQERGDVLLREREAERQLEEWLPADVHLQSRAALVRFVRVQHSTTMMTRPTARPALTATRAMMSMSMLRPMFTATWFGVLPTVELVHNSFKPCKTQCVDKLSLELDRKTTPILQL